MGYALKDLDKDGVPELIVAGMEMGESDFGVNALFDLYTLKEGEPLNLAASWPRNRYYLRTDNTILNEGSGGAGHSLFCVLRKSGDSLVTESTVFTYYDGGSRDGNYRQAGYAYEPGPDSVRLTNAEFQVTVAKLESTIYLPPLTQIA